MLRNVLTNESTQQYQKHPQPNRLDDTQERGDYRSSRIEESVYVIQQGGEFTLLIRVPVGIATSNTFRRCRNQGEVFETQAYITVLC
ncbi:hypothetical protein OK016_21710 [Vibrio chagasii]|nr:hypothetical protein [Vibrio chagasii]